MADFTRPPRVWTLWDSTKHKLRGYSKTPNDYKTVPTMSVSFQDNCPNLSFWLNNGAENKAYTITFDSFTDFALFLEVIKDAAESADSGSTTLSFKKFTFFNRQRSETPVEYVRVTIGRNAKRIVYLTVEFNGQPAASFPFTAPSNVDLVSENMEPLSPAKVSELKAKGWANSLLELAAGFAIVNAKEHVKQTQQNQNGYSRGGQSGGGQQQSSRPPATNWDDDVNF